MATNLVETVKNFFTPDVVNRASARLGESEDGIRKAVDGGVPLVFAGLLRRADHGEANALLSDARQAASHHLPGKPEVLFDGNSTDLAATGTGWGTALFGNTFTTLTNGLASFAGINPGSAHTMLNLLTPLSFSVLGYEAEEENLNAQGLKNLLTSQRSSILSALPAGINIGILHEEGPHRNFATIQGHEPLTAERPLREVPNTIWKVLLVIVIVGFLVFLITR